MISINSNSVVSNSVLSPGWSKLKSIFFSNLEISLENSGVVVMFPNGSSSDGLYTVLKFELSRHEVPNTFLRIHSHRVELTSNVHG